MAKNKPDFYEIYSKKLLRYNAYDCAGTAEIYEELLVEPRWAEQYVQRLHGYHVKLDLLCARMHTKGLKVIEENRQFMDWFLMTKYLRAERRFLKHVGIPSMRCTPDDVRSILYARHETKKLHLYSLLDPFDPKMYTDEDMETISVDRSSLKLLIAEGDITPHMKKTITLYWAAEEAWKQRTFIVSKKTLHAIGPDGYLRPGWNSCGTNTMRLSCRDPNVMQWDKELLQMFGCEEGELLVGMDKSQLEIRVVEIVSQDDYLWKLLQTGDVYSADVRMAMGWKDSVDVKKNHYALRNEFKISRLAAQYQAGLSTFYAQMLEANPDILFTTCKMHYDRFHRMHQNGIDRYAKEELASITAIGYSEGCILGGRIYYPKPPPITEACNWKIQRTASEMMNVETLRYVKRLKKEVPSAHMIFQKHDAVVTVCQEKDVEKVKRIKNETFTTSYTINGRTRDFPIETKVGQTIGSV